VYNNLNPSIPIWEMKWLLVSRRFITLNSFVENYPNAFSAVPSKGISSTQEALSQGGNISEGTQHNPKQKPNVVSLII